MIGVILTEEKKRVATIKTGKEFIDNFFEELDQNEDIELDKETVGILIEQFNNSKFSDTNIANSLWEIRNREIERWKNENKED